MRFLHVWILARSTFCVFGTWPSAFFAFLLRARCASCVFLFSSKAIDGSPLSGPVWGPREQVGLERVLRRCTARARTATQTSLFGASGTKAARKLALRAYFERRTLAKTPNATPLGGWSTRRVGCAAKGSYMGYSAK